MLRSIRLAQERLSTVIRKMWDIQFSYLSDAAALEPSAVTMPCVIE
jgi:hypothetical protein